MTNAIAMTLSDRYGIGPEVVAGHGTADDDGVWTAPRVVQTMVQRKQEKTA